MPHTSDDSRTFEASGRRCAEAAAELNPGAWGRGDARPDPRPSPEKLVSPWSHPLPIPESAAAGRRHPLAAAGHGASEWGVGSVVDGPRLRWGRLLEARHPSREGEAIPSDLGRVWQVAAESLELVARPIERFELAGTLNGRPRRLRSDEAKRPFPATVALALAGATATAASALLAWARVYRPSGNPIDEWSPRSGAGRRAGWMPPTTRPPSCWRPSSASRCAPGSGPCAEPRHRHG